MAPDSGLCSLSHLYFEGFSGLEVLSLDTESAGCHLHDGILSVYIEILMETSLSCVVERSDLGCGLRESLMGIVAYRAVAHSREHDGCTELYVRSLFCDDSSSFVPFDGSISASEKDLCLHGFPQRIDGRVCHLGGVDENLVPVDGILLRRSHRGEQNSSCRSLPVYIRYRASVPVGIASEGALRLHDPDGPRRTEGCASETAYAL